jgi:hypothetical protein
MDDRRDSAERSVKGQLVERDAIAPATQALAIVEKYETVLNYLYKILQNCSRKHGVARDAMLSALLAQPELFYVAAKSKQVSRLYVADANLATLRFWLRFMVHPDRKVITHHQHAVALRGLAEVGRMLGAWVKTLKAQG